MNDPTPYPVPPQSPVPPPPYSPGTYPPAVPPQPRPAAVVVPQAWPTPARPAKFDRRGLLAHGIWEALLAVIAVSIIAYLGITYDGRTIEYLIGSVAPTGLAAAAMAFSLRTGTPNLAVGAFAVLSGTIGTQLSADGDVPVYAAMLVSVVIVTIIALLVGAIVGALSVPSWAVTLAVAAIIQAIVLSVSNSGPTALHLDGGHSFPAFVWFAVFALVTLVGGGLWLIPGVRGFLSANRLAGPIGRWAGLRAALGGLIGIGVSGFVASVAGVVLTLRIGVSPFAGLDTTLTINALAIALLGGVSLFGRRAGVTGTLFAALVLGGISSILAIHGAATWISSLTVGIAALVGAGITRAFESIGGPDQTDAA